MSSVKPSMRSQMQYHRAMSNLYAEFAYSYYADKGVDWTEVEYNVEFLLTRLLDRFTIKQLYTLHQEDYSKFQAMILDEFELTEGDEDLCLIEAMGFDIHEKYLKLKHLGVKKNV